MHHIIALLSIILVADICLLRYYVVRPLLLPCSCLLALNEWWLAAAAAIVAVRVVLAGFLCFLLCLLGCFLLDELLRRRLVTYYDNLQQAYIHTRLVRPPPWRLVVVGCCLLCVRCCTTYPDTRHIAQIWVHTIITLSIMLMSFTTGCPTCCDVRLMYNCLLHKRLPAAKVVCSV
jgi:hypothetical protein